jgi:hypothetical protein
MKYTEEEWSKLNNESKGSNEVELHQQEISDEEIEDIAYEKYTNDSARLGFIEGIKWYIEQLKQRQ